MTKNTDCDLAYRMWRDGYEISGELCALLSMPSVQPNACHCPA